MDIIYPIFTLVLLTFLITAAVGASRLISVRRRDVNPKYYVLMDGDTPPDYVQKLSRNYANLLELPMLFYVLGALMIAAGINDVTLVNLAWLFVGLRLLHTGIHITYNHTIHRFLVFLASVITLMVMWLQFYLLVS